MPPAPQSTTHLSRGCVSRSPFKIEQNVTWRLESAPAGSSSVLEPQPSFGTSQIPPALALAAAQPSSLSFCRRLRTHRCQGLLGSPPTAPMPSAPWLRNPALLFSLLSVSSTQLVCPFLSALVHTASHQSTVPFKT